MHRRLEGPRWGAALALAAVGASALLGAVGCAPSPGAAPARSAAAAPDQGTAHADAPKAEQDFSLPPAEAAVEPAPALCGELARHAAQRPPTAAECGEPQLAAALTTEPPAARDAALAALEPCTSRPPGLVRALRAELAPAECGDALVSEWQGSAPAVLADSPPELRETLLALALGARLRRLAVAPPPSPVIQDKPALEAYFQTSLFPWITEQSAAIHRLAERGAQLRGYARAIVAVEAGMADMRFVEIARGVPIPKDMQDDRELRDVYYASLDEALEPRKQRGRDAALAGLAELARVGVLSDARLGAARALLSRVYGGRRIDALDRLLLPPLGAAEENPAAQDASTEPAAHQIARSAPIFYAPALLPEAEAEPALLARYLERGLPRAVLLDLRSRKLDDAQALLLARAHIELGRTYFRAEDFAAASRLLEGRAGEEARFLAALATALMAGPRDAAELIAKGPRFADALGNLEPLDAIASGSGPHAGLARYDATYLRELIAPVEDAEYWRGLATNYARAAERLTGNDRAEAEGRAGAARATARAIAENSATTPPR